MKYNSEVQNISVLEISKYNSIWTQEEHTKMLQFMNEERASIINHVNINIIKDTRTNKSHFFVRMSGFIGTKTDKQCKSRYQKKESQLLRELDVPAQIVEKYLKIKRVKIDTKAAKKRVSMQSTETCNSMVKQDETSFVSISSFSELKTIIMNEFMPRIQNEIVKAHLENFVHTLPSDDMSIGHFPAFNLRPMKLHQPSIGFSIDVFQDPDTILFEDYD